MSRCFVTFIMSALVSMAMAEDPMRYEVSLTASSGEGTFAPYYISSLRNGRFSQRNNFQAGSKVWKSAEHTRRFSIGFGLDVVAGAVSSANYERFDGETMKWYRHLERPSSTWIQQGYVEAAYRCLFLEAGLKEHKSALLNQSLTSGDLVQSGNSRPMPELRAGFNDFQDIPFSNGWLQISGEAAYGYMADNGWLKHHYNYYGGHITLNQLYNYKRCYFRTNPEKPFSITFGMQAAAVFGGTTYYYYDGKIRRTEPHSSKLKYFLKMLFPMQDGGEGFYSGNHLGTWDIRARYSLRNGNDLFAYTSWLWEDGSGIGKFNGWDGLWGVEFKSNRKGLVTGALVEYFDFTNQSGPIHFVPDDYTGCTVPSHVSGADDYYNNAAYNSYAYFGMSIGSPVMMAPIYNLDGCPSYVANAVRGFHVGVEGSISSTVDYRLKGGYRKAWGTPKVMLKTPMHLTAVMLETTWRSSQVNGLSVNGRIELDRGNMPSNSFGVMVGVRYEGLVKLKK